MSRILPEAVTRRSQAGFSRLASALLTALCFALPLTACSPDSGINPQLPGGNGSTRSIRFADLELPLSTLTQEQLPQFHAGKALAHQPWVKAPTITDARDGLGPLYNANTCLACHMGGGRGILPASSSVPVFSALLRLSVAADNTSNSTTATVLQQEGVIPHPLYGDQLQVQSTALSHELRHKKPDAMNAADETAPEAYLYINWQPQLFRYSDGTQVNLRRPEPVVKYLAYGPLGEATHVSLRIAPAIHGMGLIEQVPQQAIDALADPDDQNGDGISGRVNRVWDARSQSTQPGRFGLKANKPTLEMTVAGAFANDIGISNPLFPSQPCTTAQQRCQQQLSGNNADGFELPDALLSLVVDFNRALGVPARSAQQVSATDAGAILFSDSGCSLCHQPSFTTAGDGRFPQLAGQKIWPFSDFLLHDMGPDLADNRSDFLASGREWRTAPLWGMASVLSISQRFHKQAGLLHDGRATSVEEAILWHGGEAEGSRQKFIELSQTERKALLSFVESL
ncbi:di-heme oxidoredictase family protein [Thalassolituus sp. UBA2009]|jgi:CxxC motif-containing protein (DUF1111 family)|uniref:di-heme oxidoreductase family protein n=1 Tax=Thalassolituus sp. UBA2009 TaxID=1947658 RepID=UPI00257E8E62|nr:di-heme oxidoredictase family protein [Thalassolituus sp. UBA2009]